MKNLVSKYVDILETDESFMDSEMGFDTMELIDLMYRCSAKIDKPDRDVQTRRVAKALLCLKGFI